MSTRWSPTLPSFGGRLCPRVTFEVGYPTSYNSKLELFYIERSSVCSIFVKRMEGAWLKAKGHGDLVVRGEAPYLDQCPGSVLYKYLLYGIGQTMSAHFQRVLSRLCMAGKINLIKRWYQTVDGLVLPLLLSAEDPDEHYVLIDKLIKFGFENCANNYSHFITRMKSVKRLMRKDYALLGNQAASLTDMSTYRTIARRFYRHDGDPTTDVRNLMLWTQTRASGLADDRMIRKSLDKCESTLSLIRRQPVVASAEVRDYKYRGLPQGEPIVPPDVLNPVALRVSRQIRGETAHISAGPNACLESTRQTGGQTGAISRLARGEYLHTRYDLFDLTPTPCEPTAVRSQEDLASWAIQETLEHPTYVRCVRLHAVAEPSKARTITVCSLPYLIIVGILAKILQPAIASHITKGGLKASRNLWKFLYEDLDPSADLWTTLRDQFRVRGKLSELPIMGLSSDLSEATDYGDLGVARQILSRVLERCGEVPGFPVGLAQLAKTLFIGKRFCLRNDSGKYRFFVKRNGWLMGDRLTKVVLTLAHEIAVRASGLHCARICGDDVVAFSRSREDLEKYHTVVTEMGFQISEEDHYVSSRLAFYCEEACIPPSTFQGLPQVCIRRRTGSIYIDYPRIRLLIPTCVETLAHSYTDIGRFSLLGKETRWVMQNSTEAAQNLFIRAQHLQHIHVPKTADTMCPYTPLALGGDDSFPYSGWFLNQIVERKARNPSETKYRLQSLLKGKWGYRLVRNANLDNVVHKYHTLVPKLEELKELIPSDAIIEGNQQLLNSIRIDGVEPPERTFFRVWRAWYWHEVLQGRTPPEVKLEVSKEANLPSTEVDIDFEEFHHVWRDLGFTFDNIPDYLVDTKSVHVLDYMNMGWHFGLKTIQHSTDLNDIGGRRLLNEENLESFINHIKDNTDLNIHVRSTVHKYVDSDAYIKWELSKQLKSGNIPDFTFLVSSDFKLGAEMARMIQAAKPDVGFALVGVVPCKHYSYGMMQVYEDWARETYPDGNVITYVDHGSVVYDQLAFPPEMDALEDPEVIGEYYRKDMWSRTLCLDLRDRAGPSDVVWRLTTQPPEQWRRGTFPSVRLRGNPSRVTPGDIAE